MYREDVSVGNLQVLSQQIMAGQNARSDGGPDRAPSEETRKKAQAAKSYIENMYKIQHQNMQGRVYRYSAYACSLLQLAYFTVAHISSLIRSTEDALRTYMALRHLVCGIRQYYYVFIVEYT